MGVGVTVGVGVLVGVAVGVAVGTLPRANKPEPKVLSLPAVPTSTALCSRAVIRERPESEGKACFMRAAAPATCGAAADVPENPPVLA